MTELAINVPRELGDRDLEAFFYQWNWLRLVIVDFNGIRFATQSFVHALLYKVFRDIPEALHSLTFARCSDPTREAIYAVSAYARTPPIGLIRPGIANSIY